MGRAPRLSIERLHEVRPAEVDVREVCGSDPAKPVVLHRQAGGPETGNNAVHAAGVPGEHDVREQGVRPGNGHHLLRAPSPVLRYLPAVDCTLEWMSRFAAAE